MEEFLIYNDTMSGDCVGEVSYTGFCSTEPQKDIQGCKIGRVRRRKFLCFCLRLGLFFHFKVEYICLYFRYKPVITGELEVFEKGMLTHSDVPGVAAYKFLYHSGSMIIPFHIGTYLHTCVILTRFKSRKVL